MKWFKLFGPVLVSACAAAAPVLPALAEPAEAAETAGAPQAARLALFDEVWGAVRTYYYDPGFNGVDWNAVRGKYRPLVGSAESDAAFRALLRSMLGELRDAHTRLIGPAQARDRQAERTTATGAILFEVEGRPVVFEVLPDSPASEAGLRPGLRVLAVNGVPVADAVRAQKA